MKSFEDSWSLFFPLQSQHLPLQGPSFLCKTPTFSPKLPPPRRRPLLRLRSPLLPLRGPHLPLRSCLVTLRTLTFLSKSPPPSRHLDAVIKEMKFIPCVGVARNRPVLLLVNTYATCTDLLCCWSTDTLPTCSVANRYTPDLLCCWSTDTQQTCSVAG